MSLKCVIIDDEPLAVSILDNYAKKVPLLEVIATFNSAIDSFDFFQNNPIDLLFLDINMPLLDGLSFLNSLEKKPLVIITTAHEKYALKGYELDVLDYLLKPISFPRFLKAVNKAFKSKGGSYQKETHSSDKEFIFVRISKKKLKKIFIDDIIVVESLKDYIKISTTNGEFLIHQTLQSFTENLPADKFLRIHRSFAVAIPKIDAVEGNSLMVNNVRYNIGRSYLNDVKTTLFNNDDFEN